MNSSLEGRIDIRLSRAGSAVAGVEICSSRPQLAQKLMAGRGPEEAADLAGLIYSLCGKAQKVAVQAACEAALGIEPARDIHQRRERDVLEELAREHAWRLLLNWPEQAGRTPDMPSLLLLRQASGEPAHFANTLENLLGALLLGESPHRWLVRDLTGFDLWRRDGHTLVAKLFAELGDGPDVGISHCALLPALADLDDAAARELARRAIEDPAFCAAPTWRDTPAETGALARAAKRPPLADWIARRGRGAGARLLARLLELAEMPQRLRADADADGAARVVRAWSLGDNAGMAGVETSRGLLIHVVRLKDGKVADYRITAPTEWNFHPAGPLAQALSGLGTGAGLEAAARLVSQSLDPCVAYAVELLEQIDA
ncbi:MAG: nickel-dependent hydrogenase large subunit [Betaproteobacteria bacterium]|nr:nickel-dependent hydrogenase large subunit [Betaproteobacteria bacterium]